MSDLLAHFLLDGVGDFLGVWHSELIRGDVDAGQVFPVVF